MKIGLNKNRTYEDMDKGDYPYLVDDFMWTEIDYRIQAKETVYVRADMVGEYVGQTFAQLPVT